MKQVFVTKGCDGVWLGGAAVAVADSEEEARKLIDAELEQNHLKPQAEHPYTLQVVEPGTALLVWNGDY
jgi:hypothetical protein